MPVHMPMYGLSISQLDQRIHCVFQSVYNNNPVGNIPPQWIVAWEFVAPTYGYKEIGIKCAVNNLT